MGIRRGNGTSSQAVPDATLLGRIEFGGTAGEIRTIVPAAHRTRELEARLGAAACMVKAPHGAHPQSRRDQSTTIA
jgi:hypothetical protein